MLPAQPVSVAVLLSALHSHHAALTVSGAAPLGQLLELSQSVRAPAVHMYVCAYTRSINGYFLSCKLEAS